MRLKQYLDQLSEQKIPKDLHLSDVLRAFRKLGFEEIRSQPHIVLRKGKNIVSLPRHKRVKSSTLRMIIRDANVSREKFLNLL